MLDHLVSLLALRNRALTLASPTTGSTSLSVTTTGYARAAGSFITDGFAVGMEIAASGFTTAANNGAGVVTAVAAGTLTVDAYTVTLGVTGYTAASRTLATEAADVGRTISVGLPAMRAWENSVFVPVAGKPYVEEDYLPGPAEQITLGPLGEIEVLPQYILKLYGLAGKGITPLYKASDALLALFAPRTALTLSTGDVLRVRTNPAPYRSQLLPSEPGWSVVVVTVPLRAESANTI